MHKRSDNRTGGDGVDANILRGELVRAAAGEGNDGALGGCRSDKAVASGHAEYSESEEE